MATSTAKTSADQPANLTERIATFVTPAESDQLTQLAKDDGRSLASYVRQVLRNHLKGE